MFETPDLRLIDHLFAYPVGREYQGAIGLRSTDNSRYERSGGDVPQWLHIRGDTVRLRRAATYSYTVRPTDA